MAEVRIRHDDIGFVEAGQRVKLKLPGYPFQKYGMPEGTLCTIAQDVSNDGVPAKAGGGDGDAGGAGAIAADCTSRPP
jgi:hemolysin D